MKNNIIENIKQHLPEGAEDINITTSVSYVSYRIGKDIYRMTVADLEEKTCLTIYEIITGYKKNNIFQDVIKLLKNTICDTVKKAEIRYDYVSQYDDHLALVNYLNVEQRNIIQKTLETIKESEVLHLDEYYTLLNIATSTMYDVSNKLGYNSLSEFRSYVVDGRVTSKDFLKAIERIYIDKKHEAFHGGSN